MDGLERLIATAMPADLGWSSTTFSLLDSNLVKALIISYF